MRHNEKSEHIALATCASLTKANEDAAHWLSPLKQWESWRCVVLLVDPSPSSQANPFFFQCQFNVIPLLKNQTKLNLEYRSL